MEIRDIFAIVGTVASLLSLVVVIAIRWGSDSQKAEVTARELERLDRTKADRSEVLAVDKRVDHIVTKIAELTETVNSGLSRIEAKLDAEHRRRSDEHDNLQWGRSELSAKVAALEAAVYGTPRRRSDDQKD